MKELLLLLFLFPEMRPRQTDVMQQSVEGLKPSKLDSGTLIISSLNLYIPYNLQISLEEIDYLILSTFKNE